ncbi:MAG TPA: ATP-dependent DNA ligase [Candidatus Nanoarchaeia archaeon]|nr:ATP-dependent DNA ligase [Candidatus Nanoarchaeia archaeon]
MKYQKLAKLYEKLESTTKRLKKIDYLSDFLQELPEEDKEVLYLILGEVYPAYDERRIGISEKLAIRALGKATGNNKEKIVNEWKKKGDLGQVAEKFTKTKKQSTLGERTLTTEKVVKNLRKLPALEGQGTIDRKISIATELFTSAKPLEALYLMRTLIGDLRIGVQESTIRDAMARAFFKSSEEDEKEEASKAIQKAIDNANDIAKVFETAKKGKIRYLKNIKLEVGKPIKAMLAQKVNNVEEGFDSLGTPCAVEYKYDGFRLIIHKKDNKVWLFTRRLENVTKQFPEVEEYVKKHVKGESFILDSEAVGYDKKTKEYKPFQEISQRIKRKHNIKELQNKLPIEINVFDIIYYNGESYLDKSFKTRTDLLKKIIKQEKYKIIKSKQIITSESKDAKEFYKKALKDNQEGIMMKNLHAKYQPGSRVGHMLKLKPEERDLDLVITGAEYGTGKRGGWLTSFIISCKGNKRGEYLEIGKVGTGMKEKTDSKASGPSFSELTEKAKKLIKKEKGKKVEIKPRIVVSVTYQEIQHSPTYSSGYALRFPRITQIREDKPLSEIADIEEIEEDYKKQKRNFRYG